MKALIGCVGIILVVGCQVADDEGDPGEPEVEEYRAVDPPLPQNLELAPDVQAAPNCPSGWPPSCAACNGADCVTACFGDFYCETGPGWCFIEHVCSS